MDHIQFDLRLFPAKADCRLKINHMAGPQRLGERHLIIFRVAEADCAFPIEVAREILPMLKLDQVPGQPPMIEGFLNLRGRAVPAVAARRLFDLPLSEPGFFSHIIVASEGESVLGLIVDRVAETARVDPDSFRPVPAGDSFNGCAEAQFTWEGRTVAVISFSRLLLVEERRRLADLESLAQRRLEDLGALNI